MAAMRIVRSSVRRILESSPGFRALPDEKQRRIARDSVRVAAYLADPDGLVSREFRAPLLRAKPVRSSGVLTVKVGQTLQGGSAALDELMMNGVDFPAFAAALIHGVFNAIVGASIQQMEAYAALLSKVAASVDEFMSQNISDQAARDTLAQEFPELFCRTKAKQANLAWRPDAEPAARRRLEAALGLQKLDSELRQVVAATRRRLARNRQQTLATIVLMGINRIVVAEGKIALRIRLDLKQG
jgi:hypothetical protein